MALNVTTAVFGEGCNTATASPSLAQWDTEQVLQISGIDLPDSYKVEFSTVYTRNAIPVIGDASGVTIPNVLLQRSAPITAYVVLYGENGGRNREYWITIHITPGQPPETITPDPEQEDVIDQAIAALNNGVARTEAAATSAEGSAIDAADHAADAEAWAVGQRSGEDVEDQDPTYHNNSKYYAGMAEAAAEEAGQHEASWETWVQRAETAADDAEGSARAAAGSKADAETAAQTATQKATEAGNSAAAAAGSASEARQTVDGAIGAINTARDGALSAIGSAGSNAVGAVNQAGTTQTERVTTEGNTQVNRVQTKGDEVIDSIPQDYTDLVDDVDDLSRQLSDLDECCAEVNEQLETLVKLDSDEAHKYGCLWNQVDNTMQRIWDSSFITTDTSKFTYNGSVNENYNNPFDERYPWSGRKCCNIDLAAYMAMHEAGTGNLTDCVTYWEDETGFDWNDPDGVWVYTPEFWFTVYDRTDGQRVFGVADANIPGWTHAPESIQGRVWGVEEVRTIGGEETSIFLPKAGIPMRNISSVTMHDYAKNMKASLTDLYTLGAENMLYIVEFADMNSQDVLGQGGVQLYRQSSDKIRKDADNTNVVQVNTNAIGNYFPVGAIMDIGTANGGLQIASRMVVSTEVDADDATKTNVTLAGDPVTVTTAHFWSIHSRGNIEGLESAIGSHSGYIGTNGYVNAWYRGRVSHGNLWQYCLGLFHQKTTRHVWYADEADLDDYDAIDTSVHHDSGIAVATSDNFIDELGLISGIGQLGICTKVGGSGTKPVGDYHYQANADTVFRFGGASATASYATRYGRFFGTSGDAASYAAWYYSAVPRLKAP